MNIYVVALVAFLLRLIPFITSPHTAVLEDAVGYDAIALNLLNGLGFSLDGEPTLYRGPLYPAFLAVHYFLFGHNFIPVRLTQVLISTATVVICYFFAKKVFKSKVALYGSLLVAVFPPLIVESHEILTETLYTFFLMLAVYLLQQAYTKDSARLAAIAGVVISLANLAKPTTVLYPLMLVGYIILISIKKPKFARAGFVFILSALIVLAPWTYRNYTVTGKFISVAVGTGYVIWPGNFLPTDGMWVSGDYPPMDEITKGKNYVEADAALTSAAVIYMKSHPADTLKLWVKKFFRFWFKPLYANNAMAQAKSDPNLVIRFSAYLWIGVTMLLTLIALMVSLANYKKQPIIFSLFLYYAGIHTITFAIARYRLPIMPLILLLSAHGLYVIYTRYQRKPGYYL